MLTIWKYVLDDYITQKRQAEPFIALNVPKGYKVLSIANQNEKMVLYCMVDAEEKEKEEMIIAICGTGHVVPFEDNVPHKFIGTVKLRGGEYMFHIFHLTKGKKKKKGK